MIREMKYRRPPEAFGLVKGKAKLHYATHLELDSVIGIWPIRRYPAPEPAYELVADQL